MPFEAFSFCKNKPKSSSSTFPQSWLAHIWLPHRVFVQTLLKIQCISLVYCAASLHYCKRYSINFFEKNMRVFKIETEYAWLLCGTDKRSGAEMNQHTSAICSHMGDWSQMRKNARHRRENGSTRYRITKIRLYGVFSFDFSFFDLQNQSSPI